MRIVLAGAGFTALEAASRIKKALPLARVTLVTEHKTRQLHYPSELINEHVDHYDIEKHCDAADVECIISKVTSISRYDKIVHIEGANLHYDYLLLDLGSETERESIHGLDFAYACHSQHDIHQLRHHIVTQFIHAKVDYTPMHRTFVVAGGNPQSIEVAAELRTLVNELCSRHFFFPDEMDVVLVTHGQPIGEKTTRELEKRDIEIYEAAVQKYTGSGVHLSDRIIETRTLVWGMSRPNKLLQTLALQLDVSGAAVINEYMQTSDPLVFASGGCANRTRSIPVTALYREDAHVVADNIVALEQHKPLRPLQERQKPYTIATQKGKALLVTPFLSWHGSIPWKIRAYFLDKHRARIQKA